MAPRVLGTVSSESELFGLVRRTADAHPDKLLLFRGQTKLHESIQSGKARGLHVVGEIEVAWSRLAARMLGVKSADAPGARFSKALLQHYGLPTEFVDLTSHPTVAAWFALHQFRFMHYMWAGLDARAYKHVKYARLHEDYGHVLVLAFSDPLRLETNGELFCLSELPREVLRPHRQLGWLCYDRPDGSHDVNECCLGSIQVDRARFAVPDFSQERLFPPPRLDIAYRYLLGFPWVQTPTIYVTPPSSPRGPGDGADEELRKASERWCFADRAISTPEYFDNQEGYDHKWDDVTLYEPHPVRAWRGWHFELSSRFPQWSGDIASSVKVTLSERARTLLEEAPENTPCAWPDLESSDLFVRVQAYVDHVTL